MAASEREVRKDVPKDFTKKRKIRPSSSDSNDEESYLVGLVALDRIDGIFSKPEEVGMFIGEEVGDVKSVRVTRSGMVVIDCKSKQQCEKALDICGFGSDERFTNVKTFVLDGSVKRKGVISGIPLSFDVRTFLNVDGVSEVRRLTRRVDGVSEDSTSVCLTFCRELPDHVYLNYIRYRVRTFERAPLRCYSCQEYGHVAAVCRGMKRCAQCGSSDCADGECKIQNKDPQCLHCKGSHRVGSASCPRRISEKKISVLRKEQKMSYAEALKQVEVRAERNKEPEKKKEEWITLDKGNFLAFIAMVVNCAATLQGKSERIDLILSAAKKFLNVDGITGEELFNKLRS